MFTEKIQIRRVCSKFVPRFLTDDQREKGVEISQELLANVNGNKKIPQELVKGDETWFMVMMVKPRCNRRSGWGKGLLDQKNTNESVKDKGDNGSGFSIRKALSIMRIVPGAQMVHEQMYQEILVRLRDSERRKRPAIWKGQTWILYHENEPTH